TISAAVAGQSTTVGSRYSEPLQATILDADGNPVDGVAVVFTLGVSGASGGGAGGSTAAGASFSGGGTQATETTGSSGPARAPPPPTARPGGSGRAPPLRASSSRRASGSRTSPASRLQSCRLYRRGCRPSSVPATASRCG